MTAVATSIQPYDHQNLEERWQAWWEEQQLFQQSEKISGVKPDGTPKDKKFILFAFAYPSGSGLHVGHVESKTALDILARYYRMQGNDVFFPVGWDAFGLPAENYAIKTGVPPAETTKAAITTFRRQIKRIGISYDWANEIATNHPGYYHWTQWLFLQLYNQGLAYQGIGMVNWCPSCQTVLANEQVVNGECERCGSQVIQKELKQWYLKITQYQDELISGLNEVDWPEATKQHQLHWIGKSQGINITFQVIDSDLTIDCFTTAPTNWGASFLVLAPEHPMVAQITKPENQSAVRAYLKQVEAKSELDRTINKEKTGVFTGSYVLNHVTGQPLPVYVADFVLAHVGTGAVQGCPGHDQRDFEFAIKFEIPIPRVVVGPDGDLSPIMRLEQVIDKTMPGKMVNSDFLDGLDYKVALQKTMDYFEEKGWGKRVVTYKLRDWLISRQRYWGAPIPIVYDPQGQPHPVKPEHLPWKLPTDVEFKPTGESPLTHSQEFIARTEELYGKGWRPEFDTMDTFVDSSWYFLRYVSARNEEAFTDVDQVKKWLPVDLYMIGPEHIVLHLLYSRFFTKFLRDQGYFTFNEPFTKMRHQGMILGPDGKKMSKSKGNVINPDEIITKFGADTLRVYEMFMGPLESDKPWSITAVAGVYRFLTRIHKVVLTELSQTTKPVSSKQSITQVEKKLHQTLQKVSQDIPALKFNTAIASMMELINVWEDARKESQGAVLSSADVERFIKLLAPFAPFMAEELWQLSGQSGSANSVGTPQPSVHVQDWPAWDPELVVADEVIIPIQINGKVRDQLVLTLAEAQDKALVLEKAKTTAKMQVWLKSTVIKKEIYVPGKIINLVV